MSISDLGYGSGKDAPNRASLPTCGSDILRVGKFAPFALGLYHTDSVIDI